MYWDGSIQIEEDDQCASCEYFLKRVSCPLLEALAVGVVAITDEDFGVRACELYKPYKRHLEVVKDE